MGVACRGDVLGSQPFRVVGSNPLVLRACERGDAAPRTIPRLLEHQWNICSVLSASRPVAAVERELTAAPRRQRRDGHYRLAPRARQRSNLAIQAHVRRCIVLVTDVS